ncbi:MAG: DUF4292 domain-containing protein [Bacteroidales bacterium]|nr:DUF4292 domain-containing protein [Bacteroidales bacterium]
MKLQTPFFSKFILIGIAGVLLFSSCKTHRSIIKQPIKVEGSEYLFSKLKERELQFTTLSARFSADYKNGNQKYAFSGQIRIQKDTLIWLSLSVMGLEGMRLMISQDSIKYINRLNNTYLIGDWYDLNKFLNTSIEYDILQSFLIGNDISFYEDGKFKATIDKNEYKLSTSARQKLKKYVRRQDEEHNVFIQNIWLNPASFKITRADVKEIRKDNIKLDATYSSFEAIGTQLFPREMIYLITAENKILVDVTFSRINIDEPMKFPFSIPSKFTRVRP